MSIVVSNPGKILALQLYLNASLTLKLYSNNVTPGPNTVISDLVEVSGGGYASIPLLYANWEISAGSPARALYNTRFTIQFTGATNSPGTIYGYYVVDSLNNLRWLERFPTGSVPFVPINGALIKVKPRFSAASIFSD